MTLATRCKWCGAGRRWRVVELIDGEGTMLAPIDERGAVREFPYACAYAPRGECEPGATAS